MKKTLVILSIIGFLSGFSISRAFAVADSVDVWRVEVYANSGADSNHLVLGGYKHATDGYDNMEGKAWLMGKLQAYFYYPGWPGGPYFWSDNRDLRLPKEWTFYVASQYGGMTLYFEFIVVPDTIDLYLTDNVTGAIVNMREQKSYAYANTSSSPREFTVRASGYIEGAPAGDTNPPETNIVTALPGFSSSSPVTIEYAGADDVTASDALEFSYSVDNGSWSAWAKDKSASLAGLSDGSHVFSVKARDEAGNEDSTPATASFAMDTAPPSLIVNTPEPAVLRPVGGGATSGRGRIVEAMQKTLPVLWPVPGTTQSVTISGNATDAVSGLDGVTYTLTDEYGEYASSGSATVSADGGFSIVLELMAQRRGTDTDGRTYTVTVTAVDKAGNRDVKAVTVKVAHDMR